MTDAERIDKYRKFREAHPTLDDLISMGMAFGEWWKSAMAPATKDYHAFVEMYMEGHGKP